MTPIKTRLLSFHFQLLKRMAQARWSTDMASLCSGLGKLLNAGLPLALALNCLESGSRSKGSQIAIRRAYDAIQNGYPLSEVWQDLATPFFITLLQVSERSGRLPYMLLTWSEQVNRRREQCREIIKLCGYPIFVLCFNVVLLMFVVRYLLPRFTSLSLQLDAHTVPTVSIIIRCLSAFPMMMVIIPTAFGLLVMVGHLAYNKAWVSRDSRWIRCLPGMKIKQLYRTAALCLLLTTLLGSGLSLVDSLDIISTNVKTTWLRRAAMKIHDQIFQGKGLSVAFQGDWAPTLGLMVGWAELTGDLAESLVEVGKIAQTQLIERIQWTIRIGEPIILIVLGCCILATMSVIFVPLYNQLSSIVNITP